MLDDLLFMSSAFFVAAFIAAALFRFTDMVGNWICMTSFIVMIGIVSTVIIVDHNIANKLQSWWV